MSTRRLNTLAAALVSALALAAPMRAAAQGANTWSPVRDAQILAVHGVLLKNGKVLFFGGSQHDNTYSWGIDATRLYDPATDTLTTLASPPEDLFCAGHALLADGRVAVVGGTSAYGKDGQHMGFGHFLGTHSLWIFDAKQNKWSRGPSMNPKPNEVTMGGGRWYPSVVTLPDGSIVAMGGHPADVNDTRHHNDSSEIWGGHPDDAWRYLALNGPVTPAIEWSYPRSYILNDNRIFLSSVPTDNVGVHFGTTPVWARLDWSRNAVMPNDDGGIYHGFGNTSVLLPLRPGDNFTPSVMMFGGRTAYKSTPLGTNSNWMAVAARTLRKPGQTVPPVRLHANSTILPTGEVVVTGGTENGRDLTAVNQAESYNPATNTWSNLATAGVTRGYHSVALLLPDGRVWTAGSNVDGKLSKDGGDQRKINMQIYNPWYVGRTDRPTINNAPRAIYPGRGYTVTADRAISKVVLVRAGSATHSFNMDQRMVELQVGAAGTSLSITGPLDNAIAPPGYYILFALASNGVPSKGRMVKVEQAGYNHVLRDSKSFGGDFNGDGKRDMLVQSTAAFGILTQSGNTWQTLSRITNNTSLAGGWRLNTTVDDVLQVGDFDGDRKDDILVMSPWGLGVLSFNGTSLVTTALTPGGSRMGGWLLSPGHDRVVAVGNFSGDHKKEWVMVSDWGWGVIGLDGFGGFVSRTMVANGTTIQSLWNVDTKKTLFRAGNFSGDVTKQGLLIRTPQAMGIVIFGDTGQAFLSNWAKSGDNLGGWVFNPRHDRIEGVGDFNGDGTSDILLMSTWGIGLIAPGHGTFGSLMLAPGGTRFGGWLFSPTHDRIGGVGNLLGGTGQEIVIRSAWGFGILSLSGNTLTSPVMVPNGTALGSWNSNTLMNQFVGVGDVNNAADKLDEIVVTSHWGLGVLKVNGSSMTSIVAAPAGSTNFPRRDGTDGWPLSANDEFGTTGNVY